MSNVLLTATPLFGHVNPLLALGRGLVGRGHRVTMLTGERFRGPVLAAGLEFVPLPAETEIAPARRGGRRSRVVTGREDILATFVLPLDAQYRALGDLLDRVSVDVVLSDTAFLGALPLAFLDRSTRLPVLGVSVTPLSLVSVDCAPFGSGMAPGSSWFTRQRNAQINWLLHHGPLKPLHDRLDAALGDHGVPTRTFNYFDQVNAFDLTFQLGLREMEYARREMSSTVHFVGPIRSGPSTAALPAWWGDLDGSRPVVHVTQGTMDNADPGKLLLPTIQGLADQDVLVVAATGGEPVSALVRRFGRIPDNVRVAEFVPYDRLLPQVAVMVTNGGYGGVHEALRHGVPLVVAGDTEDKPEVAARVAWSGVGRNLRTGRPSPGRVRRAVRAVLTERRYEDRAARMRDRIETLDDPVTTIGAVVEQLTGSGAAIDRRLLIGD